jgi:ferredoxin--NADP+ reductase
MNKIRESVQDPGCIFSLSGRRFRPVRLAEMFERAGRLHELGSIFGFLIESPLNGGRSRSGSLGYPPDEIEALNRMGVGYSFTLTNTAAAPEHLEDRRTNKMLTRFENPLNSVIVATPMVEEFIRGRYPGYKLRASCIYNLKTVDEINAACERFDMVTPWPDINDHDDQLAARSMHDRDCNSATCRLYGSNFADPALDLFAASPYLAALIRGAENDGMNKMNRILAKKQLSEEVYRMRIKAPLIARERAPGQFIILQVDHDYGERIPLTIADADPEEGSITLIFQTVGNTTHQLAALKEGDAIVDLVGPLGKPTHIGNFGRVVGVGGGIGVAPLHPIAQALKKAGNEVTLILGARTRELVIMEEEMRALADTLIVCTDDGSYGRRALVTEPLKELCEQDPAPDMVVAIGPPVMMKFCAETTRPFSIPTVVSLNTIMVDGTGMCGGCRVTVGNETKFVCVDGPEFDGHLVDFDNMINRLNAYKDREDRDHDHFHCKLENVK